MFLKKYYIIRLIFFICLHSNALAYEKYDKDIENVLLLGWGGVQRSHLKELLQDKRLGNLELLVKEGTLVDIDIEGEQTTSKPGWAQILTGYGAKKTKVLSNHRYTSIPKGYTIFERLKTHFGAENIKTILIGAIKHNLGIRGPHKICQNCKRHAMNYWWDEELSKVVDPNEEKELKSIDSEPYFNAYQAKAIDVYDAGLEEDTIVGKRVIKALKQVKDERFFLFAQFNDPDVDGHIYGENSNQYSQAIVLDDKILGEIIKTLKALKIDKKTAIYVTANFGFDEGSKEHRQANEIWLVTNDQFVTKKNGKIKDIFPTLLYHFGIKPVDIDPPLEGKTLQIKSKFQERSVQYSKTTSSPFILKEGNKYKMWYTDFDKNAKKIGIFYAISNDGILWQKYKDNPVLIGDDDGYDRERVGSPSIVKKDGTYHMWYRADGLGLQQIGYAVSNDGIHWSKQDSPVLKVGKMLAWDSKSLVAPHVLFLNNQFYMWYRGGQLLDQDLSSIGLAVSPDGIHWEKYKDNPVMSRGVEGEWDDKLVGDPSILYSIEEKVFKMWFAGASHLLNERLQNVTTGVGHRAGIGKIIGLAVSQDGIHWQKSEVNPIIDLTDNFDGEDEIKGVHRVDNPFVLYDQNIYKMWYRVKIKKKAAIAFRTSKDGIIWTNSEIINFIDG